MWTWQEWRGRGQYEEREEVRDIFRDCFPRELIEPPAIELTYIDQHAKHYIATATYKKTFENTELSKHAINVMLELFGTCVVVADGLVDFSSITLKRANWRMLPPGDYPWDRIQEHVRISLRSKPSDIGEIILDRQEALKHFGPSEIYVGDGGFTDYIAYVFADRNIVVLESIKRDNAMYVFGNNWRLVSQLTKGEVVRNNLHIARIVHSKECRKNLV